MSSLVFIGAKPEESVNVLPSQESYRCHCVLLKTQEKVDRDLSSGSDSVEVIVPLIWCLSKLYWEWIGTGGEEVQTMCRWPV